MSRASRCLLWKLLEEIEPGDRVLRYRGRRWPVEVELDRRDRQKALLLGAFVAEGFVSRTQSRLQQRRPRLLHCGACRVRRSGRRSPVRLSSERSHPGARSSSSMSSRSLDRCCKSAWRDCRGCVAAEKRVPERVWRGSQAFKRVFLQALFTGDGSSSLLPRKTIQVSYSTYSEQLAKDVQLLLLEFGVVSRLCRYAKGEIKVVITNRRDARLFARNVGFLGAKQAKLDRELAQVPAAELARSATTTCPSSPTTSARIALRAGSTRTGCGGTTSIASSAGSREARRSSSGSPPPK